MHVLIRRIGKNNEWVVVLCFFVFGLLPIGIYYISKYVDFFDPYTILVSYHTSEQLGWRICQLVYLVTV